ncbi:MAG TPA: TetR/AcrR family transcriptional regulator [Chitinophagaceae bacterium]|jgi:AcrR family transcriptional regulator|nr:TetR/AcrR family transcriptional regulator [Chitinophagaceae bacterium]
MEALILDRASTLFFTYGLKSISMDELARVVGASKKTLYQFVSDKNELVRKVVRQLVSIHQKNLERIVAEAADAVEEVLLQASLPFTSMTWINPSFYYDLERFFPEVWTDLVRYRQEDLLPFISRNLERGIREGIYRADLDRELVPQIRLQQLHSVLDPGAWLTKPMDPQQLIARLTRFYLQAITNGRGQLLLEKQIVKQNRYKQKS